MSEKVKHTVRTMDIRYCEDCKHFDPNGGQERKVTLTDEGRATLGRCMNPKATAYATGRVVRGYNPGKPAYEARWENDSCGLGGMWWEQKDEPPITGTVMTPLTDQPASAEAHASEAPEVDESESTIFDRIRIVMWPGSR